MAAVSAVFSGMAAVPRHDPADAASVEADLAAAERAGLQLAIKGRTVALLPVACWIAQRLEAKNKELGTRLLACELTCAGAAASLREVGVVSVKGRQQPVRVFAPALPAV